MSNATNTTNTNDCSYYHADHENRILALEKYKEEQQKAKEAEIEFRVLMKVQLENMAKDVTGIKDDVKEMKKKNEEKELEPVKAWKDIKKGIIVAVCVSVIISVISLVANFVMTSNIKEKEVRTTQTEEQR